MHEHSFIEAIVSQIKNKENIKSVKLEAGELAGIEANDLKEHLHDHTGWDVSVETKKSIIKCSCGFCGRAKVLQRIHELVVFECPNCGNLPEIVEGRDIKIMGVVYD